MESDAEPIAPPSWWVIIEIQRSGSPAASTCSMRTHRGIHQVEQVRAEVEQGTALDPPRRRERAARQGRAGDEAGHPAAGGGDRRRLDEGPADGGEPVAQHQHGLHPGLVDRGGEPLGVLEGEGERLLQDQVLAGPRGDDARARPARREVRRTRPPRSWRAGPRRSPPRWRRGRRPAPRLPRAGATRPPRASYPRARRASARGTSRPTDRPRPVPRARSRDQPSRSRRVGLARRGPAPSARPTVSKPP